jgi:hypothetical protein
MSEASDTMVGTETYDTNTLTSARAAREDLFAKPTSGPSTDPESESGAYTADGKADRYGRYRLPHPESGRVQPYTRATTFAKTISDTFTLNMWGRRMSIKGLTMRPDLYAQAAATSLEDRNGLNAIAEKAAEVAGSKVSANLGTALHAFTEQYDRGENPHVPAPWDADVTAYAAALAREHLTVVPEYIEHVVVNDTYQIAGTFDRIYQLGSPCPECGAELAIGDLKTGRTLEYGWGEIEIQLAIYANAERIWTKSARAYQPMPKVCKCTAIVAHLPVGGKECFVYDVDIKAGWEAAALCAQVREWRKAGRKGVLRTHMVATDGAHVEVDAPTWAELIAQAVSVEELSLLWSRANEVGAWTDGLTALGLARKAQIQADRAGG